MTTQSKSTAWYARNYIERFGMKLVPIEPKRKFPTSNNWGNNLLDEPSKGALFYDQNPDWNMGIALGASGYCSLDIDCYESLVLLAAEFGIDLGELSEYPTIQGASKGKRIMFKVPDGVNLPYVKLNWPTKEDPKKKYTVFELRAAGDGKQRQDVLPPSIHPDTNKPYKWLVQPTSEWPTPPSWLLALWQAWDAFKPQFQAACPWLPQEDNLYTEKSTGKSDYQQSYAQDDVNPIDEYCNVVPVEDALEQYGYKRKGKERYISPHSSTGLAGVVIFRGKNKCWIHHASDPLCSDESERPVNSFDLFCYYEHSGDVKAAVKAVCKDLGIERKPVVPANTEVEVVIDSPVPMAAEVAPPVVLESENVQQGSYDYITPLIHTNDKGKPYNHPDNLREICRRLDVVVRYNQIKKEEEILIPNQRWSIDNKANASLAWLQGEASLFKYSEAAVDRFITLLADQNQFNPVVTWVMSKPWDGQDRMQALYDTVKTKGCNELKEILMKRWLISAVAAAFEPEGVSAHGVLVLQGDQYLGKTKWFKSLAPKHLNVIKDGVILRTDDKDSVKECLSYWMVELGELDATMKKSDIEALKAFLTKDSDVIRTAYARKPSQFARRTVFFGSVNPREFLHDPTGNRRYWSIECESLDHSHDIDMQQLWAQVYAQYYKQGEGWFLLPNEMEMLNTSNEDLTVTDPIDERLSTRLAWDAIESLWEWKTVTDTLIDIGLDRPTKGDVTKAGQKLAKLNGNKRKRTSKGRLLFVPPLLSNTRH